MNRRTKIRLFFLMPLWKIGAWYKAKTFSPSKPLKSLGGMSVEEFYGVPSFYEPPVPDDAIKELNRFYYD